jgi:hypothetical protein
MFYALTRVQRTSRIDDCDGENVECNTYVCKGCHSEETEFLSELQVRNSSPQIGRRIRRVAAMVRSFPDRTFSVVARCLAHETARRSVALREMLWTLLLLVGL